MRVWFPNAPSGSIPELQRSQLAIGISRSLTGGVDLSYIRRYLDDVLVVAPTASPVVEDTVDVGDVGGFVTYFRRYLDDPDNVE